MRVVSDNYAPTGNFFSSYILLKNLRTNEELTSESIVQGSLTVYNKCVNSGAIEFGAVYQGECSFTLLKDHDFLKSNDNIEVYQVKGDDEIQLGTFYVDDAKKSNYLTTVTMYDYMDYFNLPIQENTSGTIYNVITFVCSTCGVEFGQTEEEVDEFTNSQFGVSFTTRDGTYRDIISQIARVFGRFCIIKNGKLYFEDFKTEVSLELQAKYISGLSISNYTSKYGGVYARFLANANYYPYQYSDSERDGAILSIGDLGIYEMDDDSKNLVVENLYKDIAINFEYNPSTFSLTYPDARLELGDKVTVESIDGTITVHHVTSITFIGRDKVSCTCVGINPDVAEATDAQYQTYIDSASSMSDVTIEASTNTEEIGSAQTYVIAEHNVLTTASTVAFLSTTLPITVTTASQIKFEFYNNKVKFCDDMYKDVSVGNDIICLNNYVLVDSGVINVIEIIMTVVANAINIIVGGVRNVLITTATATEVTGGWNGLIKIAETVPLLSLGGLTVPEITDSVSASVQYPKKSTITETYTPLALGGLTIG